MPIYEIACSDCGYSGELIVTHSDSPLTCPSCSGTNIHKLMSATSSMTGKTSQGLPGAGDTTCCGQAPGHGSCAGPGSCCGKTF